MELNKIYLGDAYELIKQIPDKSVDCVYMDVPYLYNQGGAGQSELAVRASKERCNLMGSEYNANLKPSENLRIAKNKKNSSKDLQNIVNGFDYKKMLDECFRVMKNVNLFIWCSPKQIKDLMDYIYIYTKHYYDSCLV